MTVKKAPLIFAVLSFVFSCGPARHVQPVQPPLVKAPIPAAPVIVVADGAKTDDFMFDLLHQYPAYFDSITRFKKAWNVQIIYTQVNRNANGQPGFINYYYNVDANKYFYPASTVKLPTALLALQKLNELADKGLSKNSTMITEAAYSGQTAVYNDPTSPDGKPTIAQYIRKLLMVSDNDAFNRLYEFLGQDYINEHLHKMGYTDVQIRHRLDVFLTDDENRHTNPVNFFDAQNKPLYQQPMQVNQVQFQPRHDSLGSAWYKGSDLVNGPMDFSRKNRISLEDLHNVLKSVIFPNSVPVKQRFNLTADDYKFVYKYMSQYPLESGSPSYDSVNYWDGYCKFMLWGSDKKSLPKNIRVFNKVGDAYGEMIDVAYIVDFDKNIEFFVSAAIDCNTDGILNDDKYDYDQIGLPFMKHLGEVLYNYETKRIRKHIPDLSAFKPQYDK